MHFKKTTIFTLVLAASSLLSVNAQSYRLPKDHNKLIARQHNQQNKIKVEETQAFLDNLFGEEEEPEIDIFTEGWNSRRVNPFKEENVPQTAKIDVSDFCMPVPGYLTSPYGWRPRFGRQHKGVDLKLRVGDTVRAAFEGKIRLTNYEAKGYGNYVIMRHSNGLETVYGHLSKFLVKEGQSVKVGDPIALGGNTGRSTGPHLHFETRYMGYPINPQGIFDFANQTVHTDIYTFDKRTYQQARNYDPKSNKLVSQNPAQAPKSAAKAEAPKQAAAAPAPKPAAAAQAPKQQQKKETAKQAPNQEKQTKKNTSYTVRNGDSLSRIATQNGMTLKDLCHINGIKSDAKIHPGQKLKVK